MKFTEGGFKKWGYELAEREFGKDIAEGRLVVKDCIADAFLQNTLLVPEEYLVIATLNLNGDYISDPDVRASSQPKESWNTDSQCLFRQYWELCHEWPQKWHVPSCN